MRRIPRHHSISASADRVVPHDIHPSHLRHKLSCISCITRVFGGLEGAMHCPSSALHVGMRGFVYGAGRDITSPPPNGAKGFQTLTRSVQRRPQKAVAPNNQPPIRARARAISLFHYFTISLFHYFTNKSSEARAADRALGSEARPDRESQGVSALAQPSVRRPASKWR